MDMTTANIAKKNKVDDLKKHKEMLEKRLYSLNSQVEKSKDNPDKRINAKYKNQYDALALEIKEVEKQISDLDKN